MSFEDKLEIVYQNTNRVFHAGSSMGYQGGYRDGHDVGYDEGLGKGYEEGHGIGIAEGKQTAEAECKAKHFSMVKYGDGTDTMEVDLPFEPDHLLITTNAPELRLLANIVAYFEFDLSALGQLAGKGGGTETATGGGSYVNKLFTPTTAENYCKLKNGKLIISGVTLGTSIGLCYFGDGVEYLVTASKYDLKPLKTRIEESIARLPAQTSKKPVYYQKAKVEAAFTTEEWNALIATKANYTFNLI